MAFSGALTLTDLNDFITPSQACIKPVEQTDTQKAEPGAASTEIQIDANGAYYEVSQAKPTGKKLEQAAISLTDCLACSGCITSAESVLITLQSHTEVLNFLESNTGDAYKLPVISIAPQSLASLAASLSSTSTAPSISLLQVLRRVEAFCTTELGFAHIYDTTFARHIALKEHEREFNERKSGNGKLPMIASACPGWVCYAEKAHSEMLPFIARTKSPQQVMGTLVKSWLGQKWGKQPDQIYHVSVMPCYDKKLEASRQDFYDDTFSTRDVDCVITTGELEMLMKERGWSLSDPVPGESIPPTVDLPEKELPELLVHPGTSSGSYLHSLIAGMTSESSDPLELSVKTMRSADYEEYTLKNTTTGTIVFKGAKCYGFRNLQNVVRKVGRESGVQVGRGAAGRMVGARAGGVGGIRARVRGNASTLELERTYDYVEVMACPGGCVNGGGQLKPPAQKVEERDAEGYTRNWIDSGVNVAPRSSVSSVTKSTTADIDGAVMRNAKWGDKEWTKRVEGAYWHGLPTPPITPPLGYEQRILEGSPIAEQTLDEALVLHADRLASCVLVELCHPQRSAAYRFDLEKGSYIEVDPPVASPVALAWGSSMDEEAENRRKKLFRTEYHAVESEIIGLAVKW